MAQLSDLIQNVRPYTPEAINPEIKDAIQQALIEFCRRSGAWREWIEIKTRENVREYRLRPSLNGRVERVLDASHSVSGRLPMPVAPLTYAQVMNDSTATARQPRHYAVTPDSRTILLHPIPTTPETVSQVLKLFVVVVPQRASESFPDSIREEWYDVISHGAREILYSMPDKPWSSDEKANAERMKFNVGVNHARHESVTRNWTRNRAIPRLRF